MIAQVPYPDEPKRVASKKVRIAIFRPDQDGPDWTEIEFKPFPPNYMQLSEAIKPLIGGGDIEHVSVLFEGQRRDMFVDEFGAPVCKGLPRNECATAIYRAATMQGLSGAPYNGDPESIPAIYGPAVIFQEMVWY